MLGLPKGSYVVPFWVCYCFLVRDYSILPKNELHRRVWVDCQDFGAWRRERVVSVLDKYLGPEA